MYFQFQLSAKCILNFQCITNKHIFIGRLDLLNFANYRCPNSVNISTKILSVPGCDRETWCGQIHPFSSIATASSFIIDIHSRSHATSFSAESSR